MRSGDVKNGGLVEMPVGRKTRTIDFGGARGSPLRFPRETGHGPFSTGIPDIEVYVALPFKERLAIRASRFGGPWLRRGFVQRSSERRIGAGQSGPPTLSEPIGFVTSGARYPTMPGIELLPDCGGRMGIR